MGQMTGKVALCTGASGGIGLATALAFAREGATVYATDIEPEESAVAKLNDRLSASRVDGEIVYRCVDVQDEESISGVVDAIATDQGRLDYAFNNAGILLPSLDEEWDILSFQRCMDINVTGVLRSMKHELRVMETQGSGAIVNTASISGIVGLPGAVAYTASKHAVIGLTKAVALTYAAAGIRVNAVCPGPTDTPMTAVSRARRGTSRAVGNVPLGRSAQPEEIAQAVIWLCSDASSYVTGHPLVVDGGYVVG